MSSQKKCPKGTRRIPAKTGVCVENKNKTMKKQTTMQNKMNKLELKYNELKNKYKESYLQTMKDEKESQKMGNELDALEQKIKKIEDPKVKKAEEKRLKQLDKKYESFVSKIHKETYKNIARERKLQEIDDEIDKIKFDLKGDVEHREKLTESEIDELIKDFTTDDEDDEIDILKTKLKDLKFDNEYRGRFTGKLIRDLYDQAFDRMQSANKDGVLFDPEDKL